MFRITETGINALNMFDEMDKLEVPEKQLIIWGKRIIMGSEKTMNSQQ